MREKADGKKCLLICDGQESHITASWIAHCMKNDIISMILPSHSSHLTQPLDVRVFGPLKTLMASAIEPLISTELHRILKAEWLSAFVEAHDKAFCIKNIQAGLIGTGILPFNPSKVINHVKLVVEDEIVVWASTPIELTTSFKDSVLMSSPLNTDEPHFANAALLAELRSGDVLSTTARDYTQKVVRRLERKQARNVIIEKAHNKFQGAVTTRKTILSGKRKVIDGEHILTTSKTLHGLKNAESEPKKGR